MTSKSFIIAALLFAHSALLSAQDTPNQSSPDSAIVYTDPADLVGTRPLSPDASKLDEKPYKRSWGIDVLLSTDGIGLGGFYRNEFTRDLSGFVALSISEARDEREFEFVNPFTGVPFVPGKKNRFLVIPLSIGVQQRLFSDQIMDNFRPYAGAAVGPTMIYSTPYGLEFFSSLGKGKAHYTAGGYVAAGAFIGSDRSTLFSVNLRYYVVPYTGGIESMEPDPFTGAKQMKKDFGGFFITFTFGSAW